MSQLVREFGKDNKSLKEVTESLAQFVSGLERQECAICFGWGHLANSVPPKPPLIRPAGVTLSGKLSGGLSRPSTSLNQLLLGPTRLRCHPGPAMGGRRSGGRICLGDPGAAAIPTTTTAPTATHQPNQQRQQVIPQQMHGLARQYQRSNLVGNVAQYPFGSVANPIQQLISQFLSFYNSQSQYILLIHTKLDRKLHFVDQTGSF
uniref:Uncharacterized 22 kDa protein in overamplified macronuclear DNA POB4 n=1 Tax=Stylonychia lemnae TaxID=5949 RepID=YPOB_STYLE|nr:RecName: Full=Uncharacterized 22 kDa protein in overamplified macronuclear DNA POB4 [Stylonychia lemnae]CAA34613.1 unnamed protein product [Stylonychia lemnae]